MHLSIDAKSPKYLIFYLIAFHVVLAMMFGCLQAADHFEGTPGFQLFYLCLGLLVWPLWSCYRDLIAETLDYFG
ncbi:hypothetical protein ACYPKM_01520 [Pseudomonas aeruginosa]